MAWIEETSNHDLILGSRYRLTLWLALPDTIEIRKKVRDAVLYWDRWFDRMPTAAKNLLGGLDIEKVETGVAATTNIIGRLSPWPLRITFKKVGGGTPFLVVAGAIAVLLILVVGAVVIVGKTFERNTEGIHNWFEDLKDTLFNPGVILAAMVAIVVLSKKGR